MLKKDGLCLNLSYRCGNEKVFSRVGSHPKAWNKGMSLPEEHKKKISTALKGRPARNKGTHLSEETKQKIGLASKGRPSPSRIKISIEGVVFESITEASKYYNVSTTAIRNWAKNKNHNAVCVEKCPKI